jgi:hypothetical protein
MSGNSQVRFLGGRGRATARAYPAGPVRDGRNSFAAGLREDTRLLGSLVGAGAVTRLDPERRFRAPRFYWASTNGHSAQAPSAA